MSRPSSGSANPKFATGSTIPTANHVSFHHPQIVLTGGLMVDQLLAARQGTGDRLSTAGTIPRSMACRTRFRLEGPVPCRRTCVAQEISQEPLSMRHPSHPITAPSRAFSITLPGVFSPPLWPSLVGEWLLWEFDKLTGTSGAMGDRPFVSEDRSPPHLPFPLPQTWSPIVEGEEAQPRRSASVLMRSVAPRVGCSEAQRRHYTQQASCTSRS